MTPDERRHGTSKSGWCIDGHHPACTYPPCPCECHNGTNVVGLQGETRYAKGGNDERPPAVTEDRSSRSDSPRRREGVCS